MTDVVRAATPSFPPPHEHPRPRDTIVAGYIISLEDGASWANKVRNDPNRVLPGNIRFSPTVLDKDFQKQEGLGVHYNVLDARDEESTTRYLVATQMKEGLWWMERVRENG